jgi:hypothetical protein
LDQQSRSGGMFLARCSCSALGPMYPYDPWTVPGIVKVRMLVTLDRKICEAERRAYISPSFQEQDVFRLQPCAKWPIFALYGQSDDPSRSQLGSETDNKNGTQTHPSITKASTDRPSAAPVRSVATSCGVPNVANSSPASFTEATREGTAACYVSYRAGCSRMILKLPLGNYDGVEGE